MLLEKGEKEGGEKEYCTPHIFHFDFERQLQQRKMQARTGDDVGKIIY